MSDSPNTKRILWTEEFSVGVRSLDEQHQGILRMINALGPCDGSTIEAIPAETVTETLTQMIQYAKEHFREEERLMKEHGYPGLDGHRSQHRQFVLETVKFCTAGGLQAPGVPEKLRAYLIEWWTQHILGEDMKYSEFFRQARVDLT